MNYRAAVTADRLREVLDYDPLTGIFRWRIRPANRMRIGQIAGGGHVKGYRRIRVDGLLYLAHRLAWLFVHGDFPILDIDHIDRNRDNNAIENLRVATTSLNCANSRHRRNNTSGFKGVEWRKAKQKWHAGIMVDGRRLHLGTFDTPEAAHAAYMAAAVKHFGEFACDGVAQLLGTDAPDSDVGETRNG